MCRRAGPQEGGILRRLLWPEAGFEWVACLSRAGACLHVGADGCKERLPKRGARQRADIRGQAQQGAWTWLAHCPAGRSTDRWDRGSHPAECRRACPARPARAHRAPAACLPSQQQPRCDQCQSEPRGQLTASLPSGQAPYVPVLALPGPRGGRRAAGGGLRPAAALPSQPCSTGGQRRRRAGGGGPLGRSA